MSSNLGGYILRNYNALAGTTATVEYLVVAGVVHDVPVAHTFTWPLPKHRSSTVVLDKETNYDNRFNR